MPKDDRKATMGNNYRMRATVAGSQDFARTITVSGVFSTVFLLDALFLPALPGFPLPLSVLVLPLWLLGTRTIYTKRLALAAAVAGSAAVVSFLVGWNVPEGVRARATINTGVFLYFLLGLVMVASSRTSNVTPFLKGFLIFWAGLALLFFVDFNAYFYVRSFWSLSGNVIYHDVLNSAVRFTGTMSDPNNAATMAVATAAFVVFRQEQKLLGNLLWLTLACLIVLASMSVSGLVMWGVITTLYLLGARLFRDWRLNLCAKGVLVLVVAGAVVLLSGFAADQQVVALAFDRMMGATLDSRLVKWSSALSAGSPLIGYGGVVLVNGEMFAPHNGHLHVLYSFGAMAYAAFLLAAFPFPLKITNNPKPYLFLGVILTGFTLNVGIYEPRYAALWAILVGQLYKELPRRARHHPSLAPDVPPLAAH